ncbi:MAG: M1 family metallopeptidase [Flavobacteriaceae bacterium]|nr:M1 family metallopeptidase [Flavobacteriaceae bacterium]
MQKYLFLFIFLGYTLLSSSQNKVFTHQDSIRGSITKERIWWDLLHYKLDLKIDSKNKYISGSNTIRYKVLKNYQVIQIDLQKPLKIIKVLQNNKNLSFTLDGYSYFIKLKENQKKGNINEITVFYEGNPLESLNPPWSGGFTWSKDENGNDFIATTCQGNGASIWWPIKDHMYDEPDNGISMKITIPKGLTNVSNGKLKGIIENPADSTKTYHWEVVNPINNYGVNVNIGDYVHFSEKYNGLNGELDCNYYVLSYNLEKAKIQFKQVPKMLEAFEYWFGPYPFYEDDYKLVEVPYLGMEHQSSITYGNGYQNGYLGQDFSRTGIGLKFDYIIIHESGHEWFANNITYKDVADMWIHESFTTYSETLYLDYHYGTEVANSYVVGTRGLIKNDKPIIGIYNVNNKGSSDMYFKGANIIHTLRQMINDDKKFRNILIGINKQFYHQTVTTQQIEDYLSRETKMDLKPFFNQYLRGIKIPVLEYKMKRSKIKYRFKNIVKGFSIPIKVMVNHEERWLKPRKRWKRLKTSLNSTFEIDSNFYIITSKLN